LSCHNIYIAVFDKQDLLTGNRKPKTEDGITYMPMTVVSQPVFQCQQCGECCEGRGGILPTPNEIVLIAQFLKVFVAQLKQNFLESTPLGLAVKNKPTGGCIFNEQGRCRIHPVKPRICRDWPFLPAILLHANEFEAAKAACPGLNPDSRHEDFLAWWQEKII
jgi:uncharacterized protein